MAQGDYLQKASLLSDSDHCLHPHLALLYVEHFVQVELGVVSDQDWQAVNRNTFLTSNLETLQIRKKGKKNKRERKINFFNHFQRD